MSLKTQIPPLLEPYLTSPPSKSLLLITETLTNTANFVIAHLISSILSPSQSSSSPSQDDTSERQPKKIILVSYLHDTKFWNAEIRRSTGVDISRSSPPDSRSGRVVVIDALSEELSFAQARERIGREVAETTTTVSATGTDGPGSSRGVHVVFDGITVPIATGGRLAEDVLGFVRGVRRLSGVEGVTVKIPFMYGDGQAVEVECGKVMVSLGHVARWVVSVRGLETGAARDVSGVVRVTRGGGFYTDGEDVTGREMEGLYLVRRDGGVEVRARGAS